MNPFNRKVPVLKVSVNKSKKGLNEKNKKLLNSSDEYILACRPFFSFIFNEIQKIRGEENNEKTKEN